MADGDLISRTSLLKGIEELKESPWFRRGKLEETDTNVDYNRSLFHIGYLERKEAIEIIIDLCIKKEPTVEAITREQYHGMTERFFDELVDNGASFEGELNSEKPEENIKKLEKKLLGETAKWEINCDGYYPYCSNCKQEPPSGEITKYCPYCGRLMRGCESE